MLGGCPFSFSEIDFKTLLQRVLLYILWEFYDKNEIIKIKENAEKYQI